jgi:methyl-accepting chemotaxis protein
MAPVFISLFVLTSISGFSLFKTYSVLNEFEELEKTIFSAEREVSKSLSDFKTQVQEWKNVLLRGHNQDDRSKYWDRFVSKEQEIQSSLKSLLTSESIQADTKKDIRNFLAAHQLMAEKYRDGYQAFIDSNFDHKLGDAAVRGIDREPAKLLNAITNTIAERAKLALETLQANTRQTLIIIILSLVAIFIATMVYVTGRLQSQIIKPVKAISLRIRGLADNNYSDSLTYTCANELGLLAESTRILQSKLTTTVDTLIGAERHVSAANDTLNNVSSDIHSGSVEQSNASDELGQLTQLLNHSVEKLVDIASEVNTASDHTSENVKSCFATFQRANHGFVELAEKVTESSQIVDALQNRSKDILGVVNVINEIADQTNLLALNAAIEAARAGEHGRGFAVVADEVRALAAKTQQSTKEINSILSAFEEEANIAVTAMHKGKQLSDSNATEAGSALNTLGNVVDNIEHTSSSISQLNGVTNQQSDVVTTVTDITQRIVALADQYRSLAAREDISTHMKSASDQVETVVTSLQQRKAN